jgi:hypothetical protein
MRLLSSKATYSLAQPTVQICRIGLMFTVTKADKIGKIAAAWEVIARAAFTQWSFMMESYTRLHRPATAANLPR